MSLSPESLTEQCNFILLTRRIRNKIVILCEGSPTQPGDRPSPQAYARAEQLPDANFYKACVPKWWSQNLPEFINCGDRVDVINTFFELQKQHNQNPQNSYLNPDKLFAIVDLDILPAKFDPNHPITDTEALFSDLYHQGEINLTQAPTHRIWVTGLIHKETYFLAPAVESTLKNYPNVPNYNSNPMLLRDIYLDMADAATQEADLVINFGQVAHRISHCSTLDCTDLDCFIQSWKQTFQTAQTEDDRHQLIHALLTLKKSKDFWQQINPPDDWSRSPATFREQLSLAIAREFYAQQTQASTLHLPTFFKILYDQI